MERFFVSSPRSFNAFDDRDAAELVFDLFAEGGCAPLFLIAADSGTGDLEVEQYILG